MATNDDSPICPLLDEQCIALDIPVTSKKRALESLAQLLGSLQGEFTERQLLDSLQGREKMGSTGIGHGVAIPHGRLSNASRPLAAFIRLAEAVDFDAPDGEQVDLLFTLLVPEEATTEHLKTLAHLAGIFSDPEQRRRLRAAHDSAAILRILCA